MSYTQRHTVETMEARVSALGAFYGGADEYLRELGSGEVAQRIRTFSQDAPGEVIYALDLLSRIPGADIVVHGPQGCASALLHPAWNFAGSWVSTDLTEQDTILGGEAKLRDALGALIEKRGSRLIFVVTTPSVSINNDDVASVAAELQSSTGAGIVTVYTSGFQSKIGINGYDAALNAICNRLVGREGGERPPFVNLLAVSETREEIAELSALIRRMGVGVNVLPSGAAEENFRIAGGAKASVSINGDETAFLGEALEADDAVPYIRAGFPLGRAGTVEWLAKTAAQLGLNATEPPKAAPARRLDGLRVYLIARPARAAALAELLKDAGAVLAGVTLPFLDARHKTALERLGRVYQGNIHVAEGQNFELANLLSRIRPDLLLGEHADYRLPARLGIPAVEAGGIGLLGWRGGERLAESIGRAVSRGGFLQKLAEYGRGRYRPAWLKRNPGWYIKQEVL